MARAPIGLKIRNGRKAIGMTQIAFANKLGISPSYLNLIEHNKRSIGGSLLKRISDQLDMDIDSLDGAADRRLADDLRELAASPLFKGKVASPDSVHDLVERHPDWAGAMVSLYRAHMDQAQTITALSNRLSHDPFLNDTIHRMLTNVATIRSTSEILDETDSMNDAQMERFHHILAGESEKLAEVAEGLALFFDKANTETRSLTPLEEVDDFIMENDGYFSALEDAATGLARATGCEGPALESNLVHALERHHGIMVENLGFDTAEAINFSSSRQQCTYDENLNKLFIPDFTPPEIKKFEIARLVAELSLKDAIEAEVGTSPLLTSDVARDRMSREASAYLANAMLLPYDSFLEEAKRTRYDIEFLSKRFGVSFERICQRLLSLRKPGSEGIPFAFMRTDPAGYITKRFSLPRLPIPRYGGACPLWAVYGAFQTPGMINRQLAAFPGGETFLFLSRADPKGQAAFSRPRVLRAVMLACDALHADRTVYGDGLDFSSPSLKVPVGLNCRLCPRDDCPYREDDPIISH